MRYELHETVEERAESDARTVERGFWRKVRRTAGRVPFLDEALAAYYCTRDPATPSAAKAVLLGALAYFIIPADLIPDIIAGLGFTDDAAALFAAITAMQPHIKDSHRARARDYLRRDAAVDAAEAEPE